MSGEKIHSCDGNCDTSRVLFMGGGEVCRKTFDSQTVTARAPLSAAINNMNQHTALVFISLAFIPSQYVCTQLNAFAAVAQSEARYEGERVQQGCINTADADNNNTHT